MQDAELDVGIGAGEFEAFAIKIIERAGEIGEVECELLVGGGDDAAREG